MLYVRHCTGQNTRDLVQRAKTNEKLSVRNTYQMRAKQAKVEDNMKENPRTWKLKRTTGFRIRKVARIFLDT